MLVELIIASNLALAAGVATNHITNNEQTKRIDVNVATIRTQSKVIEQIGTATDINGKALIKLFQERK